MARCITGRERFLARLADAVGRLHEAIGEGRSEILAKVTQRDAILRASRTGDRRHDLPEVKAQGFGEGRLRRCIGPEQALLLGIGLNAVDELVRASGHAQVAERFVVDGKERCRGTELGAHVADGGPVGDREAR